MEKTVINTIFAFVIMCMSGCMTSQGPMVLACKKWGPYLDPNSPRLRIGDDLWVDYIRLTPIETDTFRKLNVKARGDFFYVDVMNVNFTYDRKCMAVHGKNILYLETDSGVTTFISEALESKHFCQIDLDDLAYFSLPRLFCLLRGYDFVLEPTKRDKAISEAHDFSLELVEKDLQGQIVFEFTGRRGENTYVRYLMSLDKLSEKVTTRIIRDLVVTGVL